MNERYEKQLQKYKRDLEQMLRRQPLQIPELCKQYLQNNVAKSLLNAVESTFQEIMGVSLADLFKTLRNLDQDIYELQVMQKLPYARKALYEERARYLTMVIPDPEIVKRLVLGLFNDEQIETIRSHISEFQVEYPLSISFDEFRVFFRSHRLATDPRPVKATERPPSTMAWGTASPERQQPGSVESESPQPQVASPSRLRRLFSLGSCWARRFRIYLISASISVARFTWFFFVRVAVVGFSKKLLSPNLEATTALSKLRVHVNRKNGTKSLLPVDEKIVGDFREYIFRESREEASLFEEIETVVNKHVPNSDYSGFARRFCEEIVEELKSSLEVEKSRLTIRARTSVLSLGRLAFLPALPPWALFWPTLLAPLLVVQISGGVPWFLWRFIGLLSVMFVLLGTMSVFWARRQLRQAVEQELIGQVSVLVERTIKSTCSRITRPLVSRVVEDIEMQVKMRPLQRALDGSLEQTWPDHH